VLDLLLSAVGTHQVGGVRQTERHIAEHVGLEANVSEVKIVIGKLRSYKSPGVDQVPAELIEGGGEIVRSEIHTYYIDTE
jgi:hypothetical protein